MRHITGHYEPYSDCNQVSHHLQCAWGAAHPGVICSVYEPVTFCTFILCPANQDDLLFRTYNGSFHQCHCLPGPSH